MNYRKKLAKSDPSTSSYIGADSVPVFSSPVKPNDSSPPASPYSLIGSSFPEGLRAKFNEHVQIGAADQCWLINSNAKHLRIWFGNQGYPARRLALMLADIEIPEGMDVQDVCGNRRCCNPAHLRAAPPRATIEETLRARFFAKVHRTVGCFEWIGAKNPEGYGLFRWEGKQRRAHRIAWFLEFGDMPAEPNMLCHECNNPSCVRVGPGHVYLGDALTNAADRVKAGTTPRGERNGAYTKPESVRKFEKNGRAELSAEQVQVIRKSYMAYRGQRGLIPALARYYGKDPKTIADIITNRLWRDLPDDPFAQPLPAAAVARIPKHGENSPACRLSDRQVREVRFLYQEAGGRYGTLSRISARYRIGRTQILRLVNRQSRPEIPDDFASLPPLIPLFENRS